MADPRPSMASHLVLQRSPKRQWKNPNQHNGGVIASFRELPPGFGWQDVKRQLQDKLPVHVRMLFANTDAPGRSCCFILCTPFEEHISFFENVTIEVDGLDVAAEVCYGDDLSRLIELLPRHLQDKRSNFARLAQK